MNINNVVMVRAMNNIPFNGELIPSCEGKRLVYDQKSEFSHFMRKKVKNELEKTLGKYLDVWGNPEDKQLLENALQNYKIVTGGYYTTTLSFSLNGMVPDDINNNFSNMKVAVIDPIRNHKNNDFVTVETIDTTIKGRVKASQEAILLIEQELFLSLSEEQKNNLFNNYKVKLFTGSLREAVVNALIENNYPSLPLVQKKEMKNIEDCNERESMLDFETQFANAVNASRLRLEDLTLKYGGSTIEADKIAHSKLEEELPNTLKVEEYYQNKLYSFLLEKSEKLGIEITDEEKYYLFTKSEMASEMMEKITSLLIEAYGGLGQFQSFIQEYNNFVKENYLTNQEIISLNGNFKKM